MAAREDGVSLTLVAATERALLTRMILLSLAASLATIALKTVAWRLTGSVGLLSDAIESVGLGRR